ncbi:uncharacterized protein BT62DRAFT_955509 [Guyanagaster necrorhizus]|uniref:DUF202 domain-containing protein n=1 Tax=Guyanagaster necrorhizus TaxID=856835 RepID=A0A9P7VJD5_9AGAR|nr:uncharacterized protein BT62DRAFT_955509 [Guyanagaster necrorhizus MCA 3950]KAG7441692.1 hypothetical protein BT62DRAFT_955509 [Guyanagaster necrorhizus MCA 3950]
MRLSLTLENNGSVARDHLASERTFLAYVRTSLVLASTGVALVQLFSIATRTASFSPTSAIMQGYARPLGATTVLLALGILGAGVSRFFSVQAALTEGKFPVARTVAIIITGCMATLVALLFAFVLAART